MKILLHIFLSLLSLVALNGAAPLTHLVIAGHYLTYFPSDEKEFLLGSVFPDIRYLGNVARDETHEYGLKLEDVMQSTSPFSTGMRLHSFVDEVRESLVVQWNIYDGLEEIGGKNLTTLLKFIEDEILHDLVQASYFIPLFHETSPEELKFGISTESNQKWHFFLMKYLSKKPSEILLELAQKEQPFLDVPPETVKLWSTWLPILSKKEKYRDYVKNLSEHFSLLFKHPH